jgi:neutral ceramidase
MPDNARVRSLPGGRARAAFAVLVGAALAALAALASADPIDPRGVSPATHTRLPHVRVTVLRTTRAQLARTNALRLNVRSTGPARVRISTTHPVREGARLPRVRTARRRAIAFNRRGLKRVRLPLTGAGRQLIDACLRVRVRIAVRVLPRRGHRVRGATHTRHSFRSLTFETPLCPETNVVGDTRNPPRGGAGGGAGGGGGLDGGTSITAGAAASDITPPVGTPMFAYTARSGVANPPNALQIVADPDTNLYAKSFVPSDGIHTRVLARALVIERGGEKFALVQTDLGGLPFALTQEVTKRIASTGITGQNLLLSATHTHSSTGPIWPTDSAGYAALGGDFFDPRVFDLTAAGIAEAIVRADRQREPARIGVGTAEVRGASRNRNFEPFQRNPEAAGLPEPEQRALSIDPQVSVIRADAASGGPIGIWSNFAIHPTSFGAGNLLFSGDNPATAERLAEQLIADEAGRRGQAPPPDRPMVNVWTNSNEGDISPNGDAENVDGEPLEWSGANDFQKANLAGARVAEGTVRAWRAAGRNLQGDLDLGARRTFFLFDGTEAENRPVGPHAVLGAGGITAEDGFCAPFNDFAGPGQGSKFPALAGAGLVPSHSPVAVWRIGSLGIGAFPLEITRQMGARLRGALLDRAGGRLDRVVLAGLSNGYQSYTATPEEYGACHYEGSFTLFGEQQGARYRDVALPLVPSLLDGGPAPAGSGEPPELAFAVPPPPSARSTPDAGSVVSDAPDSVARMGRATFEWKGGDPNVDPGRNRVFVSLQRRLGADWVTVATEDGYFDTTELIDRRNPTWRETWQFTECDPPGTYRFGVTGRANTGSGVADYAANSQAFELRPLSNLQIIDAVVQGGVARVRARYRDPGTDALLALPRRVRTGTARITFTNGRTVVARPDDAGLAFTAPARGAAIESVSVEDACGNTGP